MIAEREALILPYAALSMLNASARAIPREEWSAG
jgi:hypothetical protein